MTTNEDKYMGDNPVLTDLIHIIPAVLITFLFQVILHEIGHLLGGLFTGWAFLFIHIYRFVIIRSDKGLGVRIVNDIGFQCIMYPKKADADAIPYTMGGCILNFLSAVISFIMLFYAHISSILWLYTWSFFLFAIGIFIMNGTSSIKRLCNDKACYNLLKSNNRARVLHNIQLLIAKQLIKGLCYSEIGDESICFWHGVAMNDIEAYQLILEYYYYLDTDNYMKQDTVLHRIKNREKISKDLRDIMEMELIYGRLYSALRLHIKSYTDIDTIEEALRKHGRRGDIHSLRVFTAYKAYMHFIEESNQEALNLIDSTIDALQKSNYIYEGDKVFCIRQLSNIKNMIIYDDINQIILQEKQIFKI